MPAGKFSEAETFAASRRLHEHLNAQEREHNRDEALLQLALKNIKAHITTTPSTKNGDLHQAVALIVDFARKHNHLKR